MVEIINILVVGNDRAAPPGRLPMPLPRLLPHLLALGAGTPANRPALRTVSIDALLSRLHKVRRTAPGRHVASCPAHRDRSPSLSVRTLDDGRVLVRCHAGCDTQSVLDAIGLTFSDLMPDRIGDSMPRERQPFSAHDLLGLVLHEARVVAICAFDILRTHELAQHDVERLRVAVERLNSVEDISRGY